MIKNAIIVGDNISPARYDVETEPRGSAKLVLRAHILSEILRNAQRWVRGYESPESKSKKFGSILDCLLLTPLQWPKRFAVLPADAPRKPTKAQLNAKKPSPETTAAIEWWSNWTRANPGEIVSQDTNAAVHGAINRLTEDPMIAQLISSSRRAVMLTAEWEDKVTGLTVPLKALLDIVPPADHPLFDYSLWDLKSTQNAAPYSFRRDAQKYGYAIQAAFYLDMWNSASTEERGDFGHVIVEQFPPFEFRSPPPLMSLRFLDAGRRLYQKALATYCKALCSGKWPGYDTGKEWPKTDCDDYYVSAEMLYDDLEDEPEEVEEAPKEETEVIP